MSEDVFSTLPWQDVLWPLSPAPALGNLDWLSGVVFMNEDRETYARIARDQARSPLEEEIVRTQMHEVFHFYQVLLTGFLYRWVWALNEFVGLAAGQAAQGDFESFDDLVSFSAALPERVTDEALVILRRHEAELRVTDAVSGLSIMSLVESHATFVEWGRSYQTNSGGYLSLLDSHGVTGDYRVAYEYVLEHLGGLAHESFSLFCFLALCSSDPVRSFTRMVAWVKRLRRESGADLDIDVERMIHDCCGYVYFGSPVESEEELISVPAYRQAVSALRDAAMTGSTLIEIFQKPLEHLDELRDIAGPVFALQPLVTGGIPLVGQADGPKERRLETLVYLMQAAWYRTLFWRFTAEAPLGQQADGPEAISAAGYDRQLDAARSGNPDGLYNLGLMSARAGQDLPSRVWWRLAATEGDIGSLRALGLAYAALGRHEEARVWLDRAWDQDPHGQPVPLSGAALLEMGQAVDGADPYAADECFRRSLYEDSVCGAYLYGSRVADRDPAEALFYLACAAGAEDVSDPKVAACAREADALYQALRKKWGPQKFREYSRQAAIKLRAAQP
jgi:tetratricopeptide (TPR) repeat protein